MNIEDIKGDPRLVTMKHAGRTFYFWNHRRAAEIAKNKHGYEPTTEGDDDATLTSGDVLRLLWIWQLPFNEKMTFDQFDLLFLLDDYPKLGKAFDEVFERQYPKDTLTKAEPPVKKAKGRPKKKSMPST